MKKSEIVYEDRDILLVEKPAGLLSIPDRFDPAKENLVDLLRSGREEVLTVHRLDRETSGLMVFAKNQAAHKALSMQFEQREVEKKYLAILDGQLREEEGRIDLPIAESLSRSGKMECRGKGKESLTLFRVLETFKGFTLVEVKLQTGRTHQIRVHFSAIGHPLAIDPMYGGREAFFLSEIKGRRFRLGKDQEERPLMSRTPLHACFLQLVHPVTEEVLKFESEVPKDFRAVVNQLRKWAPFSPGI